MTPRARQVALEGYIGILPWLVGLIFFTAGPIVASAALGRWQNTPTHSPKRRIDPGGARDALIKDVDAVAREIAELEEIGVDCVIFFATFPGYPPLKMLPTSRRW